jgi:hypothetical protein
LRAKVSEENIKSAFRLFRAGGVEPILIKGWAAALEYPEKFQRNFSDIDLCVAPEDFEKALALTVSAEGRSLNIDLHCGLRHLDTRDWRELFQDSRTERIDDVEIRILRPEDHLRVLCVHWLTDGGAYREKLLDIVYLLRNRAESFDWARCLEGIPEHRRVWIVTTISAAHRNYPLDVSKMPFSEELDSLPAWFEAALQKEWKRETKLKDIRGIYFSREQLWEQFKIRLSPNPIQATVLMDGKFDGGTRLYYQWGSFLKRFFISIKKFFRQAG